MPINTNEILNVVQQLAEQRDVKVTLKESLKGASIVGLSVFTGSVLAGPLGMLLGSFVGGVIAYAQGKDKYESVPYIIANKLTETQRHQLAESVYNIVRDVDAMDAALLLKFIIATPSMEALVLNELSNFLSSQLGYSLTY